MVYQFITVKEHYNTISLELIYYLFNSIFNNLLT